MEENKENCCCGSNDKAGSNACCEPPKTKILYKIIFGVVILAVAGILVYKFCFKPAPVKETVPVCCSHDSVSKCPNDTAKSCTHMSSSCCKKK